MELTKFERARIIGARALQISMGAPLLIKRPEKGIWANMYEFPLVETSKEIESNEIIAFDEKWGINFEENNPVLFNQNPIIHKLSHKHIYTKFWIVEVDSLQENVVSFTNIEKYPVSVLIANFIKDFDKNN